MSTDAKTALSALDAGIIENRNPLRVIGWGVNMISLRLTTDEYHYLALHQARKLAAAKHSDRGYTTEVSQHFVLAYEAIKDRERFEEALQDLRQDRNQRLRDESDDMHLTRLMNIGLKNKLAAANQKLERDGLTLDKLQQVKQNLERFVAERAVDILNKDSSGNVVSCNINSVQSLDLLTIRYAGGMRPRKSQYPWETVVKVENVKPVVIYDILRDFGLIKSTTSHIQTIASSFIRLAPMRHHVIIGVRRFPVRKGRISKAVTIPKGLKIIGSISEHQLDATAVNINKLVHTQIESIVSHLSPIIIRDKLLVIDKDPTSYKTKPAVARNQPINSRTLLDRKVETYTKRRHSVNSSTDLVLLGFIVGINRSEQLIQSQK